MHRTALVLASVCLFPLTSSAADDSAKIRAIVDAAILPVMAEYKVPGMAVAVTAGGKTYFLNYGLASRENKTPVGPATLFELGSISKTFTATLATYAQVLGKLSLDDHPGRYMPQLQGSAVDQATLLNLGSYTAGGLPLQVPDEVESQQQMIGYFQQWKPDAAPGTQRRYSNPSIGLLGHITALALNRDFADALETQLFPQLGLVSTYVNVPAAAVGSYAWGYNKEDKPVRVHPDVFDAEAYGVKSTSADMIRFVQLNMDTSPLAQPLRRAVEGTHAGHFELKEMVQGLGWEQYPYPITLEGLQAGNSSSVINEAHPVKQLTPPRQPPASTLFDKTGSTGGFGAYVAFVPAQKIGIVMLANKNYPIPARIKAAHAILTKITTK